MWIDNERVWEANTPKTGLHSSRATITPTLGEGGGVVRFTWLLLLSRSWCLAEKDETFEMDVQRYS